MVFFLVFAFRGEGESFVHAELLDQIPVAEAGGIQRHRVHLFQMWKKGRVENFQGSVCCPPSVVTIPAPLQAGSGRALGPGELSWPLSQGCVGKSLPAAPQMPLAQT